MEPEKHSDDAENVTCSEPLHQRGFCSFSCRTGVAFKTYCSHEEISNRNGEHQTRKHRAKVLLSTPLVKHAICNAIVCWSQDNVLKTLGNENAVGGMNFIALGTMFQALCLELRLNPGSFVATCLQWRISKYPRTQVWHIGVKNGWSPWINHFNAGSTLQWFAAIWWYTFLEHFNMYSNSIKH